MLATILGAVLAKLGAAAVEQVAEYLHEQRDKADAASLERQRIALDRLAQENAALAWLLQHADDPDAGRLRVRDTGHGPDAIRDVVPAAGAPGAAPGPDV